MYTAYWNLSESPFLNVVNDKFIYLTDQYKEGIARLYYLISQKRTAGMLTGSYGVGKSLTLSYLQRRIRETNAPVIKIDAIPNGELPIARHILASLKINSTAATLAEALMLLQTKCERANSKLEHNILLIDEAQHLGKGEGLYLAHYLCNLMIHGPGASIPSPLFTLILAGTEGLREHVRGAESLRRRIQLDWQLEPFDENQTGEYVQHRMRLAGGDIWSFSREALADIFQYSQGIPRSINNICDTALMLGFSARVPHVSAAIIQQAAVDTGLDALNAKG